MGSAALLNQVWALLANDATFLGFKGLTPTSDNTSKLAYLVKSEKTKEVVSSSTIPIAKLFERPGITDVRTYQIYVAKVVVETFAVDLNTAQRMADAVRGVLHNANIGGFLSSRLVQQTSFECGVAGIEAYRVVYEIKDFIG